MAEVLTLTAFLRAVAGREFVFGRSDCAMTVADWVQSRIGFDPASALRDAYSAAAEWQAIVRDAGGLDALVGRLAVDAGLKPTKNPVDGDVGVVEHPTYGATAAIKVARGWAMKMNRGLTVGPATMIAAWSVPHA